jgi:hypothetical protein
MTEKLIKRMRWRAFFYLNPNATANNRNTFDFKSTKPAPNIRELTNFEQGISELIHNIKLKPHHNSFQTTLKNDLTTAKTSPNLLIKADKTTNYYRLTTNQYNKLLDSNVTKNYKTAPDNTTSLITETDKRIATSLNLEDRIEQLAEKEAFITLKDHKPNFQNKPTCRLINPTKSEIGKISKKLLETINKTLVTKTNVNLWQKTTDVVEWFRNIDDKQSHSFISFDVTDFYPSITETLLIKALDFANKHTPISEEEKHIIIHAKQSVLIHNNQSWIKKDSPANPFDVTMGSFDGAETCELVGIYLMSLLPDEMKGKIGLYRDDGLAISAESPQNVEKLKKLICTIFKKHHLKLTIEANKKVTNFLDVTLNLTTNTYKPYTKPNNTILYVHKDSNHPPTITKNLPLNINRRLTLLSSNEQEFNKVTPPYQTALKNSGYTHTLTYGQGLTNSDRTKNRRNRNRNVTWYNPPYNANIKTNIGKKFLELIDTCFPNTNPLRKIFNRRTLKLSYSCMPNVRQHIDAHNKKTLKQTQPDNTTNRTCNCRNQTNCPMNGNCLTTNLIYQATVTRLDNNTSETYIGLTANDFKTRYRNHTCSFNHKEKQNQTELSKHVWKLKDSSVAYNINWKTIKQAKPYSNKTKRCHLCLTEKLYIICRPEYGTLNKRNELGSSCRHSRSYLLGHTKEGGATSRKQPARRTASHSASVT